MKTIAKILCVFLALLVMTSVATASNLNIDLKGYTVKGVGINVGPNTKPVYIDVERGDRVNVNVRFLAQSDTEDVKVRVWISGYEYDDIEDETELFDIETGTTYKKKLFLQIPNDIDTDDDYKVRVEITSKNQDLTVNKGPAYLRISEDRHNLDIREVVFDSSVEAGKTLPITAWVENIGDRNEEGIVVEASIPELGISTRKVIRELVTEENEDTGDDEFSLDFADLNLRMPEDAKGQYTLDIDVIYNRGHDVVTESYNINVESTRFSATPGKAIVNVDTNLQSVEQGQGAAYRILIVNLGKEATTYSLSVAGVQSWGSFVDPGFVTVQPGSTAELNAFVVARENAVTGNHIFSVNVKANNEVMDTLNLEADVTAKGLKLTSTRRVLEVGFIVLVIVLIILGLVILFTKVREEESYEEPKAGEEGQAYY